MHPLAACIAATLAAGARPHSPAPATSTSSVTGATAITPQASRVAGAWAATSRGPASRKIQLAPSSARHREGGPRAEHQEERQQQRNGQQVVEGLVERQRPSAHLGGEQPGAGQRHAQPEIGRQRHQRPAVARDAEHGEGEDALAPDAPARACRRRAGPLQPAACRGAAAPPPPSRGGRSMPPAAGRPRRRPRSTAPARRRQRRQSASAASARGPAKLA